MDRLDDDIKPSIYAQTAYEMILSGVQQFQSEYDQRRFLDSLLCQCAVFSRMFGGEEEYLGILDKLRTFDFDAADLNGVEESSSSSMH
ncbi:hypothetical protein HW090_02380 [Pseudomonas sp. ABC1]|uniref:hypothetical protein n=1 Tax=Pseudomonas sp. ABC1 TaxID=2748080 RepID=UPI0015C30509|nr:hypothetical protein [Pseudomonas sp. ABC1]QLF92114.1 hypothetical protein HW090_02380 [Pseudomonas sp. ABC1]